MCLGKENVLPTMCGAISMEIVQQNSPTTVTNQYQLSKPRLSRKIVSGVKINLNKYWTKFGEIMNPRVNSRSSLLDRLTKERSRVATKRKENDNVNKPEDNKEGTITDNISRITSPLRKRSRFQFLESESLTEIDENLVNEIREICSISANNKYSSCKCI